MIKVAGAAHGAEGDRRRHPSLGLVPALPPMRASLAFTAGQRTLRLADGPDEVHNRTIARLEFGKYSNKMRMEAAQ